MNLFFHYYTVWFLGRKAGFRESDCEILAFSNQYVDNNLISLTIKTDKGLFRTTPTQQFGFWDEDAPIQVYIPFHFLPGVPEEAGAKRRDGKINPLCVTPNSPLARELVETAIKTRDLYRIGIALHTFADTWAHQDFSGKWEPWNVMSPSSALPGIGHAQAGRDPDQYNRIWHDSRLYEELSEINNNFRFFEAARQTYRYLCQVLNRPQTDEDAVIRELEYLIEPIVENADHASRAQRFLTELAIPRFDHRKWLEEALYPPANFWENERLIAGWEKVLWVTEEILVKTRLIGREQLRARENFFDSHFFRWHMAAQDQRREAYRVLDANLSEWRAFL